MSTRRSPLRRLPLAAFLLVAAACAGEEPAEETAEPAEEEMGEMAEPAGGTDAAQATDDTGTCWVRGELAERPSPLDSASVQLDGASVKVCYGAPSARGRTVMGELVPYGQPWRAGANEATALHVTGGPVDFGGVRVEPGAYALYTVPGQSEWEVVLQDEHRRWGIPISRDGDMASVAATPEQSDPMVERLTYAFENQGQGSADLVLEWENTRVSVPVSAAGGM